MSYPMLHFVILLQIALGVDQVGHARTFASAIAWVVENDAPPLGYTQDEGAAVLAEFLYAEGKYCLSCLRGDGGIAVCSGQVHARNQEQARALEASPIACARAAYAILRIGAGQCPDHPWAPYAGGCHNRAAQIISDERGARAMRALGR